MAKSVFELGFFDKRKLATALRGVGLTSIEAQMLGVDQQAQKLNERAVQALETHVGQHPDEWVSWYMLADFYSRTHDYAAAVKAAERCCQLRPNDQRSLYSLASSLRLLTWAKYTPEETARLMAMFEANGVMYGDRFFPSSSQEGLDALGLTVDDAASRAIALFRQVLSTSLPDADRAMVASNLTAMETEFPRLAAS